MAISASVAKLDRRSFNSFPITKTFKNLEFSTTLAMKIMKNSLGTLHEEVQNGKGASR